MSENKLLVVVPKGKCYEYLGKFVGVVLVDEKGNATRLSKDCYEVI